MRIPSLRALALAASVFTAACDATGPSSIAIQLGSATVTLVQSANQTVNVTVNRTNFDGAVNLAATGLPAGVTATFAPAALEGGATTATMTLAATNVAAPGPATVTVEASGQGVEKSTATLQLTVNVAGSYTLSATPTAATVVQGATATATINVARAGGFAQGVALAATGLPSGVTATFNPSPATGASSTVTFSATAAAALGSATVTITGTTPGLANQTTTLSLTVSAPASISISLSASTATVAQGATTSLTVTVGRTNFTGNVDLTASGLPSGVTASFNPAAVPSGTASSTLTLTASSTAAPGSATVTVQGAGTGVSSATATFTLTVTVTGSYTLSASPSSVAVSQGSNATTTINVARSGGFAGAVALAATGLPSGVTASFNPASATGTSSVLTFTAAASAATGTSTVTVTGTSPGLANQTTTISLTVQAPGATQRLVIDFCAHENIMWLAIQNEGGNWTQIVGDANSTYTMDVTQKFGVAIVGQRGTTTEVHTVYLTFNEVQPLNGVTCVEESGTKTLNGTVANVPTNNFASISMASSWANVGSGQTSYQLSNLPAGALDLAAVRSDQSPTPGQPGTANRIILRRGVNIASGGSIPVLDFAATEAVAPFSGSLSVTGTPAGENLSAGSFWQSATTGAFMSAGPFSAGSATFFAVPSALLQTGDIQGVQAFVQPTDASRGRIVQTHFTTPPSSLTLAFGAALNTPTYTRVATTPYVRYRAQLASQSEYGAYAEFRFSQSNRDWWMSASAAYLGGTPVTWDLVMPDLSGVAGWQNTWALQAGVATDIDADASDLFVVTDAPAAGTTWKMAWHTTMISSAIRASAVRDGSHEPYRRHRSVFRSRRN